MPHMDILATSRDGRPQLVVEVKNRAETSEGWAQEFHRNLASHSALPATPFFLLATLDRFFLWLRSNNPGEKPRYVADAREVLRSFYDQAASGGHQPSAYALELIVAAWLKSLARGPSQRDDKRLAWMVESGLYDAIRDGEVRTQAPV